MKKTYYSKDEIEELHNISDNELIKAYQYYKERENVLGKKEIEWFEFIKIEYQERAKNQICPICKKCYLGYPAISRKDNKTKICSECGIKEALEQYF